MPAGQLQRLLHLHEREYGNCQACPLHKTRSKIVLWKSIIFPNRIMGAREPQLPLPNSICLIGEAPGPSENALGIPFVGPAGKMLDSLLIEVFKSLRPTQLNFLITNVVCCIPITICRDLKKSLGTHAPTKLEAEACAPRLADFIASIEPRAVVFLGQVSRSLSRKMVASENPDMPLLELQHPSYINRQRHENPTTYTLSRKRFTFTLHNFLVEFVGELKELP